MSGASLLRTTICTCRPLRYRAEGGAGRLIAVTLGWLIATFINKEFAYWLIFAILAAVGLYFSSI